MPYQGAIIPDDDPDYVWIEMSDEELAAELEARKAAIIRQWGLTPEEAAEDDDLVTAAAAGHEAGPPATAPDLEEWLLHEDGRQGVREWSRQEARAGKKRVLRASLDRSN